jgi:hypothetical protein
MARGHADKANQEKTEKAERLAQALRSNLRRRKAQANARKTDDPGEIEPASDANTNEGKS